MAEIVGVLAKKGLIPECRISNWEYRMMKRGAGDPEGADGSKFVHAMAWLFAIRYFHEDSCCLLPARPGCAPAVRDSG